MRLRFILTAAIAGCIGASAMNAHADSFWEAPAAGFNWFTDTNWSPTNAAQVAPGPIPTIADLATFNVTTGGGAGNTVNLGNGQVQSALGLNVVTTLNVNVRGGDAGNALQDSTLNLGASGVTKANVVGAVTFGTATANNNVTVNLSANQTWSNNSATNGVNFRVDGPVTVPNSDARTLVLAGSSAVIASNFTGLDGVLNDGVSGGSLAIEKTGTGTWTFTSTTAISAATAPNGLGQHTFSGGLTLSQGIVSVSGTLANSATSSILSGPNIVSGPLGTGTLTMNGGTLIGNLGNSATNTLHNPIALNNVAGNTFSTTLASGIGTTNLSGQMTGAGGFTKIGTGVIVLTNANTYSGDTTVSAGTLRLANAAANNIASSANVTVDGILDVTGLASGTMALSPGQVLKGSGAVLGTVGGSGLVGPGNSPGILSASATNPAGGLDYSFEMTAIGDPTWSAAGASVNDVLRLVDGTTPITSALSGGNTVTVNFATALGLGDVIRGGFYTDLNSDFSSLVSGADWQYTFTGGSLPGGTMIVPSVTQVASANFASGTITNGWVTTFTVAAVPEPSGIVLAMIGAIGLGGLRRRKRKSQ
jgi:autotransporter-associated beta strand protein